MSRNKVLPADGPPKKGLFDVDGDGDVDLCDCCRAGFLFIKHSCESLDIYLVGFPIISSVATALALAMLSFQMTGVTMFLDDIEHLSDTIGVELDLGAFHSLLFASACGVLGLNLCVIVNGITAWVARMNRKHSKRGDGKKCCFGLVSRRRSTERKASGCAALATRCVVCCVGTGFKSFLLLIVTPLLWILMITELLMSILTVVLAVLFFAAAQSCNVMVTTSRDMLESDAVDTAEKIQQQEQQAQQMASLFGSVDAAAGTSGFGSGIGEFLREADDFIASFEELCDAIAPLKEGLLYVFAAATALVVIEAIIIVRNHIFFERSFYEAKLTRGFDHLHDSREHAEQVEQKVDRRAAASVIGKWAARGGGGGGGGGGEGRSSATAMDDAPVDDQQKGVEASEETKLHDDVDIETSNNMPDERAAIAITNNKEEVMTAIEVIGEQQAAEEEGGGGGGGGGKGAADEAQQHSLLAPMGKTDSIWGDLKKK